MKRFWMLLLMVVALTMVLAMPAMAADEGTLSYCLCGDADGHEGTTINGCDGTVLEWEPLVAGWTKNTALAEGNYYLTGDVTTSVQLTFVANATVRLDLKGCTFTDTSSRLFSMNGASGSPAEFWITDTSELGTGTIKMSYATANTVYSGQGAIIWVNNASTTVNMISGTLDASSISISNKSGGAAVNITKGEFNLYGGTILGGTHKPTAAPVAFGGAVSVLSGGTLNVYGGAIEGGNAVSYTDGNGVAYSAQGGVIYSAGTLYISGGTISGGLVDATKSTDEDGNTVFSGGQNSNIYATGTVSVSGGSIAGYVDVSGASEVNISGAPTVTGGTTNLNIGSKVLTVGTMTGGNIGITGTGEPQAITDGEVDSSYAGYFFSDDDTLGVAYSSYDKKLWLGSRYCVCGASKSGSEQHVCHKDGQGNFVSGCNGELLTWLPWNQTGNSFPTVGNWYLTGNVTASGQFAPVAGGVLRVDLNNKTVTDTTNRTISMNGKDKAALWITDTSEAGNGSMKLDYTTAYNGQGAIVWVNSACTLNLINGTLDASAISLTASSGVGGAVAVQGKSTFNMFGGSILGAASATAGGAVHVDPNCFFNVYGGQITGGEALYNCAYNSAKKYVFFGGLGGAVNLDGTMTMYGGTITGGEAKAALAVNGGDETDTNMGGGLGGAIHVSASGTLTVSGGTISGGTASSYTAEDGTVVGGLGGVIYNAGEMTVDGTRTVVIADGAEVENWSTVISGGTADNGGAIYNAGTLEVSGGKISGGSAVNGGNIYATGDVRIDGTLVSYTLNEETVQGWSTQISDGIASQHGGNIYVSEATVHVDGEKTTVTLEDETTEDVWSTIISGGTAGNTEANYAYGGNIYAAGDVTVSGGKITAGIAQANTEKSVVGGKGGNIFVDGANVIFEGGVVSDGIARSFDSEGNPTYGTDSSDRVGHAGNIMIDSGSVTIRDTSADNTGTQVLGGSAGRNGGSIYLGKGSLNISGGTVSGGTSVLNRGGNIWAASNTTLNITGGVIRNGTCAPNDRGGNIHCNSNVNLTLDNVEIYGGMVGENADSAAANVNAESGCTVTIGSVQIDGRICVRGTTSTIRISGAPVIQAVDANGDALAGVPNLHILGNNLTVGTMTNGANVWVTTSDATTAPLFGVADTTVFANIPYTYKSYFHSDDTAYQVVMSRDGLTLASSANSHVHCPCGGSLGNAENGYSCTLSDGTTKHVCYDVVYVQVAEASDMASGGAFFLGDAFSGSVAVSQDLDVCLNGKVWTAADARTLTLTGANVTIADCSTDTTGAINGYAYTSTTDNGGSISINGGQLDIYKAVIQNGSCNNEGGNIWAAGDAVINLYGGTIRNGKAGPLYKEDGKTVSKKGWGGNLELEKATLNIFSGTISDGSAGGNGGNIRVDGNGGLYMYDGTISDGKSELDQGGNIFCSGTMTLKGGNVTRGHAVNGGNICINASHAVILDGVEVTDGSASGNGGNIRVATTNTAGTLTISGGLISGGSAKNGGNISLETNNYYKNNPVASMIISGGTIEKGDASGVGDNLYATVSEDCITNLTVSGGTIAGYVHVNNGVALTLDGAPVISGGTSNLNLNTNTVTIGKALSKDANVVISCSDAANERQIAIEIPATADTSGISYQDGEYVVQRDGAVLYLAVPGATVNGDTSKVYTLEGAIAAAVGTNSYVTLTDNYTGDLTVGGDLLLDMNGWNITGDVTVTTGTLKLFDTATADYSCAADTNGKTYGKIVGNISGNVARTCNTPKATYGSNYRYLIIKDDQGYHAHRFYMTVKSSVLYPASAALNYRTVLRCDQVMADYINAEGGAYGVRVTADQTAYSDYTDNQILVGAYGADGNENNFVTRLDSVIKPDMDLEEQVYNAEFRIRTCAYILIPDQFYAGAEENLPTVSSTVVGSLKEVVQQVDGMTGLNATQKALLGVFYGRYPNLFGADSNNAWQLSNIPNYAQNLELKYYCLCGDPSSTENPCADKGHRSLAWQAWNRIDSLPTEGGNWYLTGDVTLTEAVTLDASQFVCIDTQGYDITCAGRVAVVGDGAILNLVNSNTQDTEAVVSGVGEGSALMIDAGGNVSLYTGVTLTGSETTGNGGIVVANGELNIYGGNITAAAAAEGATLNGGAVYVGADGYLYMNKGTVSGTAAADGGAIYSNGQLVLEGTAAVAGATATNGGAIYCADGELHLSGNATVSGGTTSQGGRGGNIYAAGQVYLSGNATVSGGSAITKITEKADGSGYSYTYGRGGNLYVTGSLEMTGGTVTGGNANNEGGNIYLTGNMTISGGTLSNGVAGFTHQDAEGKDVTRNGWGGNIEMSGSAHLTVEAGAMITGGQTKGNGGSIRVGYPSTLTMTGGQITGGSTADQGGNLFITGNATISGGKIIGGSAGNGGNLAANPSNNITISLSNVEISGGTATQTGGNIRIQSKKATVNIGDGTQIFGGVADQYGGNITCAGDLNMTGGQIYGGVADRANNESRGGNIYINSSGSADTLAYGSFTMSGGSITGGQVAVEKSTKGYGGNIYSLGDVEISGTATITGGKALGSAENRGGNIFISKTGSFTMSSGTLSDGEVCVNGTGEGYGGNLYSEANVTVSGTATITGGKAYGVAKKAWGGNVYVTDTAVMTMSGGRITGGYSIYNTGNVHVASDSSASVDNRVGFTLSGGSISGGQGVNTTGNLYVGNTTASITGGSIYGGKTGAGEGITTDETANIYVVNGVLDLSGGSVNGGIQVFSYTGVAGLRLSGAPVVDGTGLRLFNSSYKVSETFTDETTGETTTTQVTRYYTFDITVDLATLDPENASVAIFHDVFKGDYTQGLCLAAKGDRADWSSIEAIARGALVSCGTDSQVTYEADGIYLRPGIGSGSKLLWHCKCGANYGEVHMAGCDHYDLQWNEWTGNTLPTEEGYWYLSRSSTKQTADGQSYVTVKQTAVPYDYATVNATGERIQVRTILAQNTAGEVMTDEEGSYITVAQYYERNKDLSYADEVGAALYTADSPAYIGTDKTVYTLSELTLDSDGYEIYVDLNGYALESESKGRIYNLNVNTAAKQTVTVGEQTQSVIADRTKPLTVTVVDGTKEHSGSLNSYGVYTDDVRLSGSQPQGGIIWMPRAVDTMNLCFVTVDASPIHMGTGLAIYTGGDMNLHYSHIIGGISQGAVRAHDDSLTASATGGGAMYIYNDATVTMTGGSIKNGMSIYRYMCDIDGVNYDRGVGGGNVFVSEGTFIVDGGEISGGRALIYTGDGSTAAAQTQLPYHSYGSGGGIYVHKGELIVKGNAKIYDNYTGTITGTPSAKADVAQGNNDDQYRYYDAITPVEENITISAQANIYTVGEIMTLENLGSEAKVGLSLGTLEGQSYEGTFAYADANYFVSGNLVSDDGAVTGCQFADGKLYVPVGDESTYLVGYGIANIQPEMTDLQAGVIMTNYGNERDTSTLYTLDGYYDITRDSEAGYGKNYLGGWDTQLYVTALATTDGEGDTVIIISADCSTFSDGVANNVKRMVSNATGVPQDNISISSEHQHSAPAASTFYNEDGTVKTNYAKTFYNGVVAAAVAAMNDRQQATVSVGTLDTTADGDQYNFVRNVKVTFGNGTVGMLTDNHKTHYFADDYNIWIKPGASSDSKVEAVLGGFTLSGATLEYESDVDTTLQLVQYTQADGSVILMTNFQTHPHVGSSGNSCYVHSDVVGAFRYYLEENLETGTETDYKVMYFSGAGGNVNTTTSISGKYSDQNDSGKYPYADITLTKDTDAKGANSLALLQKADIWGQSLAALTCGYLNGVDYTAEGTNKTVAMAPVTGGSNNVAVNVQTVECTRKVTDASDKAIGIIAQNLFNWSDGSYLDKYLNISGSYETWYQYVGHSANPEDQVYSAFDAKRIRYCLLWEEAGKTQIDLTVTAYAMGEIGFIAAPYEMFQENGQQIKSGASGSYAMTIVATQANGGNGYIPSAQGYVNGGYSTDSTSYAAGTGEQLADAFVEMLNGLK